MGSRGLHPWTDLQPRGEQELAEARPWQLLLLEPLLRLAGMSSPAQRGLGSQPHAATVRATQGVTGQGFTSSGCGRARGPFHKWKRLALLVFSPVSNASGECEGKGSVGDYLGKQLKRKAARKKIDLYLSLYVRYGIVMLISKSIILRKYLGVVEKNLLSLQPRF